MSLAPTAIIYFKPTSGDMAKDLAARVRNDPRGIKTLLCWGTQFRDERDLQGCQAVMIQRSLNNAGLIATCYQNFAAGVEIHYLNDDGSFEDEATDASQVWPAPLDAGAGEAIGPASEAAMAKPDMSAEAGAVGTGLQLKPGPDAPDEPAQIQEVEKDDAPENTAGDKPAAEGEAGAAADTPSADEGPAKPDASAA